MKRSGQHGGFRLLSALALCLALFGIIKTASLISSGSYAIAPVLPAAAQEATDGDDATAAVDGTDGEGGQPEETIIDGSVAQGKRIELRPDEQIVSDSERTVLESLRLRREALQKAEEELRLRENLLKAAEQRIDAKIAELKTMEERIEASLRKKEEEDNEQIAGLVTMYENMKPKNAAQIFNSLRIDVLLGVAKRMKPRAMAGVLARMDPGVAQRLTVELAKLEPAVEEPESEPELEAIAPQ